MTISVDFFLCFRRRRVRRLDLDLGLLDRLALQTTTTTKSARLLRCSCFSFGGYIQTKRRNVFGKKKGRQCPPERKSPPTTPGEDAKKKVYIIIWEADVLPLHHKRVVENNTPSTFRRELFIDIYILSSTLAGNRIRGSSCFFSLSQRRRRRRRKHKVHSIFRLSLGFSI